MQYLASQKVTTDWTTISWTFTATFPHDRLQFCFGKLAGTIDFDDLVLTKEGSTENLIGNGDFATSSLKDWGANWNGPSFAIVKVPANTAAIKSIKTQTHAAQQPAYNLSGQRVSESYKGLVIVKGKKMMRK